jgi:hypothetical protein
MITSGTVYLVMKDGKTVVAVNKYQCPSQRRVIIKNWERWYCSGIDGCFIQIVPDFESELIKEDGTNVKFIRVKRKSFAGYKMRA